MAWIYLLLAGVFEIAFAICLKLSDGLTKLKPTVMFLVFSLISFLLLSKSLNKIPVGTAYLVWTGIGAIGTAILGMTFFHEPCNFWRIFFIIIMIIGIIGLKIS